MTAMQITSSSAQLADDRRRSPQKANRHLRMLFTSAGRRVELIQCFRAAAADLGIDLMVAACDTKPGLSAACASADMAFQVPRGDTPEYAAAIRAICRAEGITLVIPTIDTELQALAEWKARFHADGIRVAVGGVNLIKMARDKLATAAFLAAAGVPAPRTAEAEAVLADPGAWKWPVFAKPRGGSAGRGAGVLRTPADLRSLDQEPMIVQEWLRGDEYTVNMFFDAVGSLRCAIPHKRLQVRAGEVEKGVTHRLPVLTDIARRLAAALPEPEGALCFQAIVAPDGKASVFEINARFGGGYPLADHAGASFARWIIEEQLGLPVSASDEWTDGVTMLRYDAAVFGHTAP